MKILQLWAPYRERGGEEFMVNLVTSLLGRDHEVETCVFELDPLLNKPLGPLLALTSFYHNGVSLKLLKEKVASFQPDVVLSHNIMPAGSYAVYRWLAIIGMPVAYYVHNFRPYSVNGYCWSNGKIADGGLHLNYFEEVIHGAWQNSIMRSAWYAGALWYSHLTGIWEGIDRWITISGFMEKTMIQSGVSPDQIDTLRHPWITTEYDRNTIPNSVIPTLLFIGRISEEKGIRVLLEAWTIIENSGITGRLIIAGGGPLVPWLEKQCGSLKQVKYVGYADSETKRDLLGKACALVVPSVWWEPLGLVVYESYAQGRPVLAARSGGLTETVEHGITGWLHEPGNAIQLSAQISQAFTNPEETNSRGQRGQEWLRNNTNPELWIRSMQGILNKCVLSKTAFKFLEHEQTCRPLEMVVYLADQNPGHDRSFGISRMSEVVLTVLANRKDTQIHIVASESSQQGPDTVDSRLILPFKTRGKFTRLVADHFHPIFARQKFSPDIWYYPKGFLPFTDQACRPSVITIHDTIIQYYRDHYPTWRNSSEYFYWARMLKHTLKAADCILTVSNSSKRQIQDFMERYEMEPKQINVTYEPCLYETISQPINPLKKNYVIHLASMEPHKRTAQLVDWWLNHQNAPDLPPLHLIGSLPPGVDARIRNSKRVISRPFMKDEDLQSTLSSAKALILSSEVEGFGLPAVEAYYLGTPVCHVIGTSVEEILSVATKKGRFSLNDKTTLFDALDEVMNMSPIEVHQCGLTLRTHYSAEVVTNKMMVAFRSACYT